MRHCGRGRGVRFAVVAAATVAACAFSLLTASPARADSNCDVTQDRSLNSDQPVTIDFINSSGRTVSFYWRDFNGQFSFQGVVDAPYATLGTNSEYIQDTFMTHPWQAIDSISGACLGYTLPSDNSQT